LILDLLAYSVILANDPTTQKTSPTCIAISIAIGDYMLKIAYILAFSYNIGDALRHEVL